MRTIAIVLGDNDFGNTFRPLLETVYRAIKYHEGVEDLDEATIRQMVADGIQFHYTYWQAQFRRSGDPSMSHTVLYLKTNARVYFDAEAEKLIETKDYDSGAWYLELQTGKIYCF